MKLNIGIPEKNRRKVAELLTIVLADEHTLYMKTRKGHWNVTGRNFTELHRLYERQYKELEIVIDEIAERIGKLGHKTAGTMTEYAKLTTIQEHPGHYPSSDGTLKALLVDHETIIVLLRGDIEECSRESKDAGTADLLTGILKAHETMAWVLRRHLE
jgi:starvation-inducible DNA-binding protein